MQHYFTGVQGLGKVAVSRHAQSKCIEDGITEEQFVDALKNGKDTPDGMGAVWREKDGVRLVVVLRPNPFRGAKLVTTVYRVYAQERAT